MFGLLSLVSPLKHTVLAISTCILLGLLAANSAALICIKSACAGPVRACAVLCGTMWGLCEPVRFVRLYVGTVRACSGLSRACAGPQTIRLLMDRHLISIQSHTHTCFWAAKKKCRNVYQVFVGNTWLKNLNKKGPNTCIHSSTLTHDTMDPPNSLCPVLSLSIRYPMYIHGGV